MTGVASMRSLAELDLAAGDAGDVEQVVDQPGQVPDLPLDDVLGPVDGRSGRRASADELDGVAMAASGFRSSWASIARNSSLRRSASLSGSSAVHLVVDVGAGALSQRTTSPVSSRGARLRRRGASGSRPSDGPAGAGNSV